MFSVKSISQNGFDAVILTDEISGNNISVLPKYGAMLHQWNIFLINSTLNVIDHYKDREEIEKNLENNGFKSAKLSPFVGRIRNGNYHFAMNDYRIKKYFLDENAIHGLLYNVPFEILSQHADEQSASVALKHVYQGEDPGYPFNYECIIEYGLRSNNKLTITTKILNTDAGHIPIADGWHPYFTLGVPIDELQLEFQCKEKIVFDKNWNFAGTNSRYEEYGSLKKLGAAHFDDCFLLNFAECQPLCVLRNPIDKIQIEIHPERSYPYLQIYTPAHRQSIALENMSSIPDAHNHQKGLIVLAPQTEHVFATHFIVKKY